jgi:hypothetical protein
MYENVTKEGDGKNACAIAKSGGNRWREEGREEGRRGRGGREREYGEEVGGEEGGEGGGGEGGDEGGELCWIQPSRFHGTDFLYHSSGGKGEQLSPTSALLLFYCFRLSPGLPFLLGPAPITSEVREELEINPNCKQTVM